MEALEAENVSKEDLLEAAARQVVERHVARGARPLRTGPPSCSLFDPAAGRYAMRERAPHSLASSQALR